MDHAARPKDLIYAVDERPPVIKMLLLAMQQLFVVAIYVVLTAYVAQKVGLERPIAQNMISLTFLAMGLASIFQAQNKGPIGSGFLVSSCVAPTYLQASILALSEGGLPLLGGMMIFSGVCEMLFALFTKRLRFLFPPVVTGLIFCFIALTVGIMALQDILVTKAPIASTEYLCSFYSFAFTLVLIVALNIWGKGLLRLLCVIIGLLIGGIAAYLLHVFSPDGLLQLDLASYIQSPSFASFDYAFSWRLAPVFVITALAAGLRTIGVLTICQQINDAQWQRIEPVNIRKGVIADGFSVVCCGLLNVIGVGVSPSSVSVTKATGATSRKIAYFVALLCFLCALSPKISVLLLILPHSIVAAFLMFACCLMFVGGLEIITVHKLDARKTIIVGLSLLIGLSTTLFPAFYKQIPVAFQPITQSLMLLGALTAIVLNVLFRLGIRQKSHFIFEEEKHSSIQCIQERLAIWQISLSMAEQISAAVNELYELIVQSNYNDSDIHLTLQHDEISLAVSLEYNGYIPNLYEGERAGAGCLGDEGLFAHGLRNIINGVQADKIYTSKINNKALIRLVFEL